MFSVVNSGYSLYCTAFLCIQVHRTKDSSTILGVVRYTRFGLYRNLLLRMKTREFFLYWDTQCHLFCSPVLFGIYLILWHRLTISIIRATYWNWWETRGPSAFHFYFVLKKTEAENYPKANTSQYEFSCQCFVFQLNSKVFLEITDWQMPWLILSKVWLAPAFEISTHEIVHELCYILSLKAGFKELRKTVNLSTWSSALTHT